MASHILCKDALLLIHSTICYTNYYLILITTHYILVLPYGLSVTLNMGARNWPLMTSSPNHKDGNTAISGHIVTYVTYNICRPPPPAFYCIKQTVRPTFCQKIRKSCYPHRTCPHTRLWTYTLFCPTLIPQFIVLNRLFTPQLLSHNLPNYFIPHLSHNIYITVESI